MNVLLAVEIFVAGFLLGAIYGVYRLRKYLEKRLQQLQKGRLA